MVIARPTFILGLSAFYHDSAACLLRDGEVVAAAQEERFTRRRHDAAFPSQALAWCLAEAGIAADRIDHVCFYDKPVAKFGRLIETHLAVAPWGLRSFLTALPVWLRRKLWMAQEIEEALGGGPRVLFTEHHQAHAASAFFPSPFDEAAVLTLDGVGEWATTTAGVGRGGEIELHRELRFPHSLGLLYSAFTYHAGFKVNSGEYKLMGLAPYGEPRYRDAILTKLMDLKADGTFRLDLSYFDYVAGLRMTSRRFDALFDGPPRAPEGPMTQREKDLAASIQSVTEEVVLRLCRDLHHRTGLTDLCLSGGIALNCVANGKIIREGTGFRRVFVQPAAGDAGSALGAALAVWHGYLARPRAARHGRDSMGGALLGPRYSNEEVEALLGSLSAPAERLGEEALLDRVADLLAGGAVVGWFHGRMEFGPRALGSRSILGDPRDPAMQRTMNLKIKFRESFRPFAPAVPEEDSARFFDLDGPSPYMLFTAQVRPEHVASLPAVTHVDGSARVQTVSRETHPRLHALLRRFGARTGVPVLINTSFNVRGEPIVCTPRDAYSCFMHTNIDYLVLEDHLLDKRQQPSWTGPALALEPD